MSWAAQRIVKKLNERKNNNFTLTYLAKHPWLSDSSLHGRSGLCQIIKATKSIQNSGIQQTRCHMRKERFTNDVRSIIYLTFSWFLWQLCATMMSWVGRLLPDSELFLLLAENSQILLKISVIRIVLTFMYLVVIKSVIKQPT